MKREVRCRFHESQDFVHRARHAESCAGKSACADFDGAEHRLSREMILAKCYTGCMKKINELMAPDWAAAFRTIDSDVDDEIAKMGEFLRGEICAGYEILPEPKNIFRAFSRPLANVKVLIVGQDPYPTPGNPVGLSFSVSPEISRLPASLNNIFMEAENDLRENGQKLQALAKLSKIPEVNEAKITTEFSAKNGDLSKWFEQGVLLMNRNLTVRAHAPNSHAGRGWEKITEDAVKILAEKSREKPLVAILWGRNAQELEPLLANRVNILVIKSAHPSPMSARRGFFGSRPFSRTNEFLIEHGVSPIDWSI